MTQEDFRRLDWIRNKATRKAIERFEMLRRERFVILRSKSSQSENLPFKDNIKTEANSLEKNAECL